MLLVLLVSSLIIDDGLHRSSFNGLQMLCGGLDVVCGSNDNSSDSIEPKYSSDRKRKKETKEEGEREKHKKKHLETNLYEVATEFMQIEKPSKRSDKVNGQITLSQK